MWFDMVRKHDKRSFKVVIIPINGDEMILARTEFHGMAIEIAKYFDEKYSAAGMKFMIEVR